MTFTLSNKTTPWNSAPPRVPQFLGLDVETTGLEDSCLMLELALVTFDHNLMPINSFTRVITPDLTEMERVMSPEAREMHVDSGLYDDVLDGNKTAAQVEKEALHWLDEQMVYHPLPMVGSSITFDRNVLRREMPALLKRFHYRSVDATSFMLVATHMGYFYETPDHGTQHRALDDVKASANLIRNVVTGIELGL